MRGAAEGVGGVFQKAWSADWPRRTFLRVLFDCAH